MKKDKQERTAAIVLAGGKGSRMIENMYIEEGVDSASIPRKQYMKIAGKKMLQHSLDAFEKSRIDEICLVVATGDEDYVRESFIEKYGYKKVKYIVTGGSERYLSVLRGLEALEEARKMPEGILKMPGRNPKMPEEILRTMEDASKAPEKAPKIPEEGRKAPEKALKIPEEGRKAPEDASETPGPADGSEKNRETEAETAAGETIAKEISQIILPEKDYVLIHDAARALLTPKLVNQCIRQVRRYKSCVIGMPAQDTIRIVDKRGWSQETPLRSRVWMAHTPQCFIFSEILDAYRKMIKAGDETMTDDGMVMEKYGVRKVRMFEGSYENIKITTPQDFLIGEIILQKRKIQRLRKKGRD